MTRTRTNPTLETLVTAAVLVLLLGLGPAVQAQTAPTQYPLVVIDDLGHEVAIASAPTRVVAMAPSHTETVCALAACDLLVGVDANSNHPPEVSGRATLGSAFSPDLEALIALAPDLVLVDEYSSLREALAPHGIAVYAGTPQTYAETLSFIALLGEMLDRNQQASELALGLAADVQEVGALLQGVEPVSVFLEIDATPFAAGRGSYLDELLWFAGGVNVLPEDLGQFPQVDPEFVVAVDPQVIVLLDAPFGVSAADVARRPGFATVAAVRGGRVYELGQADVDLVSRAGPRLGEAVRLLARLLHPDRVP